MNYNKNIKQCNKKGNNRKENNQQIAKGDNSG